MTLHTVMILQVQGINLFYSCIKRTQVLEVDKLCISLICIYPVNFHKFFHSSSTVGSRFLYFFLCISQVAYESELMVGEVGIYFFGLVLVLSLNMPKHFK